MTETLQQESNLNQPDSHHKEKEAYWQQLIKEFNVVIDPREQAQLNRFDMPNMEQWKTRVRGFVLVKKEEETQKQVENLTQQVKEEQWKRAYLSSTPATKRKTPKQSYRGTLKKRYHLVEFVIDKQIAMRHAHERSFEGRKSIRWEKMCKYWNKAHPDDQMTPDTLKNNFNNAIRDENVKREYDRATEDNNKIIKGHYQTFLEGLKKWRRSETNKELILALSDLITTLEDTTKGFDTINDLSGFIRPLLTLSFELNDLCKRDQQERNKEVSRERTHKK